MNADALHISDDDDPHFSNRRSGGERRPEAPRGGDEDRPQATSATQGRRWLPGPAGTLGREGVHLPAEGCDVAATQRPREKFRRTPAWITLEEQSRREDGSRASGLRSQSCASFEPRSSIEIEGLRPRRAGGSLVKRSHRRAQRSPSTHERANHTFS